MLDGKRIMVVEDEALLALDLSLTLEDEGATVAGPYHQLERAMKGDTGPVDAAILDVDLAGVPVFPLADELHAKGIPIVFHTGRANLEELRTRYGAARIVTKPSLPEEVTRTVEAVIANANTAPNGASAAE